MSTILSINSVAKKLNLTPQQVRNLCRNGNLKADKPGGSWIIYEDAVQEYYDKNCCGVAEDQAGYHTRKEIINAKKPVALSFFSGAMGLDIGLEEAGFNVILASEIDNACRKTILKNKPNITLIGNILDYAPPKIKKLSGLDKDDEIDLIVGGPPCQAFSTAGKRKSFEDERGNVFLTFIELIITLKPKYAVIENVRGLLSAPLKHRPHNERGISFPPLTDDEKPGGALNHILKQLKIAGYKVSFNLYNAANFGVPQIRERVVLVCSRGETKPPYLEPSHSDDPSFGLPRWRTFKDISQILNGHEQHHINFPEKRLKYYRYLRPGDNWRSLPVELQKEAMGKTYYSGGGKTGFYRRLAWDKPSPTLVTHPAMPATDLAHPIENRPLSIEEYKKIQEFPDNWYIEGSLLEQYKQIGNAVPVGLGRAIGKHILKLLRNEQIKNYPDFQYSRYLNTDEVSWQREFRKLNRPVNYTLAL